MLALRKYTCILLAALFFIVPANALEEEMGAAGKDFIKWIDFDVSYQALVDAMNLDIETYKEEVHLNWIELLSYLGAKYGGDFSSYREKDLNALAQELKGGATMNELTKDMNYYSYYREAYGAVLSGFLGEYQIQAKDEGAPAEPVLETTYGLKSFSPIAAGFYYQDYDDFGCGRTYGYSRRHLGHDMFGAVGTPIVAVESGVVEVMGWNQYGGWRIGIRSLDGRRYHYYAHLRKDRPYHEGLEEGQLVKAGDVIGYMGRTGYSANENVNNIRQTHLHYGLQLIFDESQKECNSEIWIDLYAITRLLERNRSETYRVAETKEFFRVDDFDEEILHQGLNPLEGKHSGNCQEEELP